MTSRYCFYCALALLATGLVLFVVSLDSLPILVCLFSAGIFAVMAMGRSRQEFFDKVHSGAVVDGLDTILASGHHFVGPEAIVLASWAERHDRSYAAAQLCRTGQGRYVLVQIRGKGPTIQRVTPDLIAEHEARKLIALHAQAKYVSIFGLPEQA